MRLKTLLTSDLHLGMKFAGYPDVREELCEARFVALERLVRRANEESCELLVVAGDLFNGISPAKRDNARAREALGEFDGKLVAVLPGNHDFVTPGTSDLWATFAEQTSGNVVVLDSTEPYPLTDHGIDACLYPAPCTSKTSPTNNVSWIAQAPRDDTIGLHIGVAHGTIEGVSPDFDNRYYPMTVSELSELNMDCWFVGHTHVPWRRDTILYPGTPEPDGFDCRHGGTAFIVELDSGGMVEAREIACGTYRFMHETRAVRGAADLSKAGRAYASGYDNCLLKLKVTGMLPKEEYPKLDELRRSIADSVFLLQSCDAEVKEEITREDIDSEFTPGSLPHRLLHGLCENDADWEALQIAYQMLREARR